MNLISRRKNKSNDWFEDMVENINTMQSGFVTNMRAKVNQEQESSKNDLFTERNDDRDKQIHQMLDNVDKNTKQFIGVLTQEMDKIIKSHNLK